MYTITELVLIFAIGIYAGYVISELRKSTAFNRCVSLIIDLRQKIEHQAQRIGELESFVKALTYGKETNILNAEIYLKLSKKLLNQSNKHSNKEN